MNRTNVGHADSTHWYQKYIYVNCTFLYIHLIDLVKKYIPVANQDNFILKVVTNFLVNSILLLTIHVDLLG